MISSNLFIWCAALTSVLVTVAMITDLRSRRIPNLLTFSAFAAALLIRGIFQGWVGLGLALSGALVAPLLLFLMHGGKGIGMGDLKLLLAIGAIFGPGLGLAATLVSALCGGVLAIAYMFKPGGMLAGMVGTLTIGLPFVDRRVADKHNEDTNLNRSKPTTIPYGVAIGIGSIITLAVCWWTGQEQWFLSFAGIAASL